PTLPAAPALDELPPVLLPPVCVEPAVPALPSLVPPLLTPPLLFTSPAAAPPLELPAIAALPRAGDALPALPAVPLLAPACTVSPVPACATAAEPALASSEPLLLLEQPSAKVATSMSDLKCMNSRLLPLGGTLAEK